MIFGGHFDFFFNFRPPFWIEIINVERWNAIPLPTLSQATCIPNLKKVEAKLRAWQCRLTFYKMAAMTSPKYASDLKLKSDYLHVCQTHCVKFQANRLRSLATRLVTISVFQNGGHDVIQLCKWAKRYTQATRCLSDYLCKVSTKSAE